ncbi:hypothetical protein [Thalassotalea agarivorans]|uniref:Competence protein CoiA-like family protein n=1 Tax=Thalassotalea agarivorans TaxID=349064 RepID=A0A1H9ZL42_THASX|nr:hypothetical protein [Thalassotalea agarivorans]SES82265.1 hypothetical protein SAMN05660429_00494 [Thalassotalea agarivorans]
MALEDHILFGNYKNTGESKQVEDVANGEKCECYCFSCGMPLSAQQGTKNVWHFKHATYKPEYGAKKECMYSFDVSVLAMAKQIILESEYLKTPNQIMYTPSGKETVVADRGKLVFDSVEVNAKYHNRNVDALIQSYGKEIAVIFKCRHRDNLLADSILQNGGSAVLTISLEDARYWLDKGNNKGFKETLREHIIDDYWEKDWAMHPRRFNYEQENGIKLTYKPTTSNSAIKLGSNSDLNQMPRASFFACTSCEIEWLGRAFCSWCKSKEYVKPIPHLGFTK